MLYRFRDIASYKPAQHHDAVGGLMFYRCYFLLFNVAPLIRQRVDGSRRELLH